MIDITKATQNHAQPYGRQLEAIHAANRFIVSANGKKYIIRFSLAQRLEHLFLVVTSAVLAVTGLAQSYYNWSVGSFILNQLGGIHSARQIHHIFAVMLLVQALYHIGAFITDFYNYFTGYKIWFKWHDVSQFVQKLKYDLRLSPGRPQFDRFNFEQKIHYWTFVLGITILVISGLIQWFPIFTTRYLPGWLIPVAHAMHQWQAIFTVLVLVTWHLYHNVLKRFNRSIFSGVLSVEQMEQEHPLELAYLQKAAAVVNRTEWPVGIELGIQAEMEAVPTPVANAPKEAQVEEPHGDAVAEVPPATEKGNEQGAVAKQSADGVVMSGDGQA